MTSTQWLTSAVRACALALPMLAATVAHAEPVSWTLDKKHSRIGFSVRHLGLAKVRGEFTDYKATIKADRMTGKLASVEAAAKAKSVDTGIQKRDDHLRSDDFLAADKHPALRLKTKSIEFSGNDLKAVVGLTIRGTTKTVTFEGELLGVRVVDFGQGKHRRAAYEASTTISRKAFGLKFSDLAEGVAIVGDDVEITLEIEMTTAL